jgi:hypothetical protein
VEPAPAVHQTWLSTFNAFLCEMKVVWGTDPPLQGKRLGDVLLTDILEAGREAKIITAQQQMQAARGADAADFLWLSDMVLDGGAKPADEGGKPGEIKWSLPPWETVRGWGWVKHLRTVLLNAESPPRQLGAWRDEQPNRRQSCWGPGIRAGSVVWRHLVDVGEEEVEMNDETCEVGYVRALTGLGQAPRLGVEWLSSTSATHKPTTGVQATIWTEDRLRSQLILTMAFY